MFLNILVESIFNYMNFYGRLLVLSEKIIFFVDCYINYLVDVI